MTKKTSPLIPSPCKGICKLDHDREYCVGCLRTVEQIRDWPILDNTGRMKILEELKIKRDILLGRKRKRRRAKKP